MHVTQFLIYIYIFLKKLAFFTLVVSFLELLQVFQRPYRYFLIALKFKCFLPRPIAIKFSPVIGYGLKYVKMQF